jgi:four helix bundle protein
MPSNHNDLEVFRLSYDFVVELYPLLDKFPESENKNLVLQMKRAAVSLPLNIAEGCSRNTDKQFLPFLTYTYGSSKELEVCLRLSQDFGFMSPEDVTQLSAKLDLISRKIVTFMRFLEDRVKKNKNVYVAKMSRGENPWST